MIKAFENGWIKISRGSIENIIKKDAQSTPQLTLKELTELIRKNVEHIRSINDDHLLELLQSAEKNINLNDPALYNKLYQSYMGLSIPFQNQQEKSAFAVYKVGKSSKITIHTSHYHLENARLHMDILLEIGEKLIIKYNLSEKLKYFTNPSIYKSGKDNYRYFEYIYRNESKITKISELKHNEAALAVFEFVANGKKHDEILNFLIRHGIPEFPARTFLTDLINSQLLVSELQINVTGKGYLQVLTQIVKKIYRDGHLLEILSGISFFLREGTLSNNRLLKIRNRLNIFSLKENVLNKDPQVTYIADLPAKSISISAISTLSKDVESLFRLGQTSSPEAIIEFKSRFTQKYGKEKVPLLEALDETVGLGYHYNVEKKEENDYYFSSHPTKNAELTEELRRQYLTYLKGNGGVFQLDTNHFKVQKTLIENDLFPAFFISGQWLSRSLDDLDKGNGKFFLDKLDGPSIYSGIPDTSDKETEFKRLILEIHKKEEDFYGNEYIVAEVILVAPYNADNNIHRSIQRKFELQVLGRSLKDRDNKIDISEVSVFMSAGKLILYCDRLKKRIIPRIPPPKQEHLSQILSIHRFLYEFQFQDVIFPFKWNWDFLPSETEHLPRVELGKTILSRESWSINYSAYSTKNISDLCSSYNLPRYFTTNVGEEILIDLKDRHSLKIFKQLLSEHETLIVYEFLGMPEDCLITFKNEKYASKFIIPFYSTKTGCV